MDLKEYIRSIPDYPKKGILFRDITTLIKNEKAFEKLWYVVVEVGDDDVLPNFFVFSSKEVSDAIKQKYKDYLAKPKKDGTL